MKRIRPTKIPRALSIGEETFALHIKTYKLLAPEREWKFHPTRKWKFDFAFPDIKLAVEIDGGTASGKSRHSFGLGYEKDAEKINTAVEMGWRVLRFTTRQVKDCTAIKITMRVMKGKP